MPTREQALADAEQRALAAQLKANRDAKIRKRLANGESLAEIARAVDCSITLVKRIRQEAKSCQAK